MDKNIEFEEMRQQLAALKQQLAKQTIINENIMRRATAEKASRLRRKRNRLIALGAFAAIFSTSVFYLAGFHPYLVVYTFFMCLFEVIMTVTYHNKVSKFDFMSGDLKSAVLELKKLRTRYKQWLWIGIPLVLVFLLLLCHSLLLMDSNPVYIISMVIGGILGAIIGLNMNRNVVRLCDDIIRDIESV